MDKSEMQKQAEKHALETAGAFLHSVPAETLMRDFKAGWQAAMKHAAWVCMERSKDLGDIEIKRDRGVLLADAILKETI